MLIETYVNNEINSTVIKFETGVDLSSILYYMREEFYLIEITTNNMPNLGVCHAFNCLAHNYLI